MKILIDADGCPVTGDAVQLCAQFLIKCVIISDTAHSFSYPNTEIITVDKGADSADYSIANRIYPADLVITQDYGLAAICLARGAHVMHQDGWMYTDTNIDALLLERHTARKNRAAGIRSRGHKKRTESQNQNFRSALAEFLTQQSTDSP